ncbi:ABC-type multidrug transport system fused ATPase/permease subunit [Kineococcus xinjiangensis]|uniref:ABC-type multidrug transport system fused ATPase/permease subunit n=1 Tax=Kineococcus xinjiangensis TaxID=512762 RepID=A0A2S6ITM6_9ACTN|nr:ABC transporter ATP-binding protein [Kineococcus xinjiangensis]PPK97599.1 ABC-type multidrug transport system fused ATPase/permease subunit [Kineococcus xinjiangensis]
MRALPLDDPGPADLRSPAHFLLRTGWQQRATLAAGMTFGITWMLCQAVFPAVVGRALDAVVLGTGELLRWCGVVLALSLVQAAAAVMRHRCAVANRLTARFRVCQQLGRRTSAAGTALTREVPVGEVLAGTSSDAPRLGDAYDVTQRATGSVLAIALVAVLVLRTSVPLGLLVLLGTPAVVLVLVCAVRPLQERQREQRRLSGELTSLGADTVAGLRVLRGIGGEEVFTRRYRDRSQEVRRAGVRVARWESALEGLQVLAPGLLVAALVWGGARATLRGEITPGQLVALYGYAAFLTIPLRTLVETADKYSRAFVAARRVVTLLRVQPLVREPARPAAPPSGAPQVADPATGLRAAPGRLTAVVADPPEDAASLARRLARVDDTDPGPGALLAGVPLRELPLAEVRRRVLLAEDDAQLFSGTLREQVDPTGEHPDADVLAALWVAAAEDVLDLVAGGLDGDVSERGRSLSGGQRQRLALARAVLRDPDVLVLVEPTSAVDAHTEARIARRLHAERAGRTTVVTTASPLVLATADEVHWLRGGRLLAAGRHEDLLRVDGYRDFVTRGGGAPPPRLPPAPRRAGCGRAGA